MMSAERCPKEVIIFANFFFVCLFLAKIALSLETFFSKFEHIFDTFLELEMMGVFFEREDIKFVLFFCLLQSVIYHILLSNFLFAFKKKNVKTNYAHLSKKNCNGMIKSNM
jgi:hypothetical protein